MARSVPSLCVMLISAVLMAGCVVPESQPADSAHMVAPSSDPLEFSWSPPPGADHFVFLLQVTAGQGVACQVVVGATGGAGGAQGLPAYLALWNENSTVLAVSGDGTAAGVGPANSARIAQEVNGLLGPGWVAWATPEVTNGSLQLLFAAFDLKPAPSDFGMPTLNETVHVACDSHDATIRFWDARAYQMVTSHAAEGGVTARVVCVVCPVDLALNQGNRYDVAAEAGDLVLMHVVSSGPTASGGYQAGEVRIEGPEYQGIAQLPDARAPLHREWTDPGGYGFTLNRLAQDYGPLLGVIASFELRSQEGGVLAP